jgi:hypothetical protein
LLVEKTVVLDTNTKLFMHRLEDFTKTLDQHQFPTENGGCYRLVSLIDHSQVSYLTRMLISARYSKPELETPGRLTLAIRGIYIPGSGEGREEKEVEPIQLDVETVASERLAVTAKCDTPEAMDYFSEILRWMMKCWPEATQQLLEPGFQQELQLMISDAEQDTWKPILGTAQQPTPAAASATDILPAELTVGGKYGTYRDLTIAEVRDIVARCLAFQRRGGKVPDFYRQLNIEPDGPRSFTLETLRGWLKDAKFAPQEDT